MTLPHESRHTAFILVGATATGKTAVSNELAHRTGCAVVSADSMLVYRGMNIGTAKPTADELRGISFHGADLCNPDETFSTGAWLDAVRNVFKTARVAESGLCHAGVIVAGGTGLYINALIHGIDAPAGEDSGTRAQLDAMFAHGGIDALHEHAERLSPGALDTLADKQNPRRVIRLIEKLISAPTNQSGTAASATRAVCAQANQSGTAAAIAGLTLPVDVLDQRIRARVEHMFQDGLLDEVQNLCAQFPRFSETAGKGIGYAEALAVLRGDITRDEAVDKIALRTRQFAKRQRTWFRNKLNVAWVDAPANEDDVARAADDVMNVWSKHGPTPVAL